MNVKEMTDKELGERFNYYANLINSGQNSEENLEKLDNLYAEIIDRKLAKQPNWF
tara:strand:- start:45 stop:209 length:165 start_codon:yes stop_codon:yes gene_type:complete